MNLEFNQQTMNTPFYPARLRVGFRACVLAALTLAALLPASFGAAPLGDLQPYWPLNSQVPGGRFGHALAAYSTNRFIVGTPYLNTFSNINGSTITLTNAGAAYLYDVNSNYVTQFRNPNGRSGDYFGWSAAEVGVGLVLIGAPYKDIVTPPPAPLLLKDVGAAYLFNGSGGLLRTYSHPGAVLNDQDEFGYCVARLGEDRILIGAPDDDLGTTNGTGKVFLFDLNGTLLKTLANPIPQSSARFGHAITSIGTNRFAVGAPFSTTPSGGMGTVYFYDGAGNLLK